MNTLYRRIGYTFIFLFCISSAAVASSQPWADVAAGEFAQDQQWPNGNTGYEFVPLVDGKITHLGALHKGVKYVMLYNSNGSVLARARVRNLSPSSWRWTYIRSVRVKAGETYTVAADSGSGGSTMYYGVGFPQLPLDSGSVTITRAVTGAGGMMPTTEVVGQMRGQVDVKFMPLLSIVVPGPISPPPTTGPTTPPDITLPPVPDLPPVLDPTPVALDVQGVFPGSPVYVDQMPVVIVGQNITLSPYNQQTFTSTQTNIRSATSSVVMSITNNGTTAVQYSFDKAVHMDVQVIDANGQVVTSTSRDIMALPQPNIITIEPGSTFTTASPVTLTNNTWRPLPDAVYTFKAVLLGTLVGAPNTQPPSVEMPIEVLNVY